MFMTEIQNEYKRQMEEVRRAIEEQNKAQAERLHRETMAKVEDMLSDARREAEELLAKYK